MSVQIHARVSLQESTRIRCYAPNPLQGHPDRRVREAAWEPVEGVRVKLSPVSGEPFGSATPGGELLMVIAAPAAAKVFLEAPIGQEFDVVFSPVVHEAVEEAVYAGPNVDAH